MGKAWDFVQITTLFWSAPTSDIIITCLLHIILPLLYKPALKLITFLFAVSGLVVFRTGVSFRVSIRILMMLWYRPNLFYILVAKKFTFLKELTKVNWLHHPLHSNISPSKVDSQLESADERWIYVSIKVRIKTTHNFTKRPTYASWISDGSLNSMSFGGLLQQIVSLFL